MKRIGFTLIELLVVIAIIALLAAILFPAVMRAKDAAYRGSDMSHMNELRSALQLYRVDQGGYPPEMFGYVEPYGAPPANPIAADQTVDYLFPKRVSSLSTFQPAYDRSTTLDIFPPATTTTCSYSAGVTTNQGCVVWPGAPVSAPYTSCSSRAFGADTSVTTNQDTFISQGAGVGYSPLYFYNVDGYDMAPVKNPDGLLATRSTTHFSGPAMESESTTQTIQLSGVPPAAWPAMRWTIPTNWDTTTHPTRQ